MTAIDGASLVVRGRRRRHCVAAGAAVVCVALAAGACGPSRPAGPRGAPGTGGAATAPTTTTTTGAPSPSVTVDPGALPQTPVRPVDNSAAVSALGAALWRAVVNDQPAAAMPFFFPLGAYQQLKALSDDAADYQGRLVAHFDLDVAAAHALLGTGAATATLVGLVIPGSYVRWIPPGGCYNRLGYWFVPGSREVYREGGAVRSFGIAALDSWRGRWYIIHLGSEVPPAGQGVVDAPAAGVGSFGSPSGC